MFKMFTFKALLAFVVSVLTVGFGTPTTLVYAVLVFIAVDYVTGVIAAGVTGKLNSNAGLRGIAKKFVMLAICVVAYQVDKIAGSGLIIRNACLYFYASNEVLSIIENAGRIGIPVPTALKNAISVLKG